MFAQSKKFVIPLVAVLVACMAVETTASADIPLPIVCTCGSGATLPLQVDHTQQACETVGQTNGAVWNATRDVCQIGNEAAYHNFHDNICPSFTVPNINSPGGVVAATPGCVQDVPVPQSCVCANASGVNTAAQTQQACTLINNVGTVVDGKCEVTNPFTYSAFGVLCSGFYPDSKSICSV